MFGFVATVDTRQRSKAGDEFPALVANIKDGIVAVLYVQQVLDVVPIERRVLSALLVHQEHSATC